MAAGTERLGWSRRVSESSGDKLLHLLLTFSSPHVFFVPTSIPPHISLISLEKTALDHENAAAHDAHVRTEDSFAASRKL